MAILRIFIVPHSPCMKIQEQYLVIQPPHHHASCNVTVHQLSERRKICRITTQRWTASPAATGLEHMWSNSYSGMGRSSSVSIVTRLRVNDRSQIRGRGNGIFSLCHRIQTGSGAHPASYPMSTGVKRPGRDSDHSLLSRAEVKNGWSCTSTPTYVFMPLRLVKHRNSFTLRTWAKWGHCGENVSDPCSRSDGR
jgi:hypothetical protein